MRRAEGEHGAALIMILLFTALMFILVTTMLGTLGNEVVISRAHRDSARAFELAESGIEEAIQRIKAGHQFGSNPATECYDGDPTDDNIFENSLAASMSATDGVVRVCRHAIGASAASLEIQSNSQVGVGRRRISQMVFQILEDQIPNILFGENVAEGGNKATIASGDVYARQFAEYVDADSALRLTYSGWWIRKNNPPPVVGPCYTYAQCSATYPNWRPGHRRAAYQGVAFNPPTDTRTPDNSSPNGVFTYVCSSPGAVGLQTIAANGPGYQDTDQRADLQPGPANVAATATTPLYGCDDDLLPYAWMRETFKDPDTKNDISLWFKMIAFETWRGKYWVLCLGANNPEAVCTAQDNLIYKKRQALLDAPQYGAVPPFVNFDALIGGADSIVDGDGKNNENIGSAADLGCKAPEMSCPGGTSNPRAVLFTNASNFTLTPSAPDGHGTLLVDGDLTFSGDYTYYGTIIVNGTANFASGNVKLYGGLVARYTAKVAGSAEIYAGGSIAGVPLGSSTVEKRGWWER